MQIQKHIEHAYGVRTAVPFRQKVMGRLQAKENSPIVTTLSHCVSGIAEAETCSWSTLPSGMTGQVVYEWTEASLAAPCSGCLSTSKQLKRLRSTSRIIPLSSISKVGSKDCSDFKVSGVQAPEGPKEWISLLRCAPQTPDNRGTTSRTS